ncbi:MAG: tetratricopeptide repeat protein [Flavobacteriales bacterium]|nr:tetratricopeptide repeat protein [Flavobacteriales bacterium]
MKNLNKALFLNLNNNVALATKGILLDKQKKYEEAKKYYLKSIESDPNVAQTYSNYASNRLQVGDYNGAVQYGEKAVKLANNIKDKGVLCLSYHKIGMIKKRDSLYTELEKLRYRNLDDLKEIFNK